MLIYTGAGRALPNERGSTHFVDQLRLISGHARDADGITVRRRGVQVLEKYARRQREGAYRSYRRDQTGRIERLLQAESCASVHRHDEDVGDLFERAAET